GARLGPAGVEGLAQPGGQLGELVEGSLGAAGHHADEHSARPVARDPGRVHRAPGDEDERAGRGPVDRVADEELELAVEHVEQLVGVVVDVRRRGEPGRARRLQHGDRAAGVLAARLDDQPLGAGERPAAAGGDDDGLGGRRRGVLGVCHGPTVPPRAPAALSPDRGVVAPEDPGDTGRVMDRASAALRRRRRDELLRRAAAATDVMGVFDAAARRLRALAPYDAAAWVSADPVTGLPTGPALVEDLEGITQALCSEHWRREFVVDDVHLFRRLARAPVPAGALRAAVDDPAASGRWRTFLRPLGFDDEL